MLWWHPRTAKARGGARVEGWRCAICGEMLTEAYADHRIPWSVSFDVSETNVQNACVPAVPMAKTSQEGSCTVGYAFGDWHQCTPLDIIVATYSMCAYGYACDSS